MSEEKFIQEIKDLKFELKKYKEALKKSNIDFFDVNLRTGEAKESDYILKILGYSGDEMNTFEKRNSIIHPDDLEVNLNKVEQLKAGLIDNTDLQFRLKSKNGQWYWIKHDGLIVEAGEEKHFVGLLREVTDEKSYLDKLRYLAHYDGLTHTFNRRSGLEKLNEDIRLNNKVIISYIDINDFKKVNDEFGHLTGDRVLRELADNIMKVLPKNSYLIRMGGDEFLIVFVNYADVKSILDIIESKPIVLREGWVLSMSTGTVTYDKDKHKNIDQLMHAADMLMYESKRLHKSTI